MLNLLMWALVRPNSHMRNTEGKVLEVVRFDRLYVDACITLNSFRFVIARSIESGPIRPSVHCRVYYAWFIPFFTRSI